MDTTAAAISRQVQRRLLLNLNSSQSKVQAGRPSRLFGFVCNRQWVAGENGVGGIDGDAEPAQREAGQLRAVEGLMKNQDCHQQLPRRTDVLQEPNGR